MIRQRPVSEFKLCPFYFSHVINVPLSNELDLDYRLRQSLLYQSRLDDHYRKKAGRYTKESEK